jgi:hypothetical protein
MGLEVDPLPRGVGAQQDPHRLLVRVGIESTLHILAAVRSRSAREDQNALVGGDSAGPRGCLNRRFFVSVDGTFGGVVL